MILCILATFLASTEASARRPGRHVDPAARPAPVTARVPAQLIVKVDAALKDRAGRRKAGLLCFPNGSLKIRDFVSSDADLHGVVAQGLRGLGPKGAIFRADGTTFELHLIRIKTDLCARAWGVFGKGDKTSLSGSAAITFAWSLARGQNPRAATADIVLAPSRQDPATPVEILKRAVDQLLELVAADEATAAH